jgi:hypothetical protein
MSLLSTLATGASLAASLPVAVVLVGAVLWTSWLLACELLPDAPASVRVAGALAAAAWLCTASFYLLSLFSGFTVPAAVAAWGAAAWVATARAGGRGSRLVRTDFAAAVVVLKAFAASRYRRMAAIAVCLVALRTLRGMVAPPLSWDALKYHLPRAAQWVQDRGMGAIPILPHDWGLYGYFYPGGEILWAWALLPVSADALIPLASASAWAAAICACYPLARMLGASPTASVLTALLVGFTPASVNLLTAAYVDNSVLACFLLGTVFVGRALLSAPKSESVLGAGALGVAAGIKFLAAPLLAAGLTALFARTVRSKQPVGRRLLLCAAFLAAAAVALPGPLRNWMEKGSPFWPLAFRFAGRTLFPGDESYMALMSGAALPEAFKPRNFLALIVPNLPQGIEHLNFGPAALLVLLAGAAGVARLRKPVPGRPVALFMLAGSLLVLVPFAANARGVMAVWPHVVGRYLMPAWACLILVAAPLASRDAELGRKWTLITGLILAVPLGWTLVDARGMALLAAASAAGAVLAWFAVRRWGEGRRAAGVALAIAAFFGFGCAWGAVRSVQRYATWEGAASLRAYDMHWLDVVFASAWPVWEGLDTPSPKKVAVVAGYFPGEDNWLVYPLLGSHLQNRLVYVSPLPDDSIPTYRDQAQWRARARPGAWLQRLRAAGVEAVAVLPPLSVEAEWMEAAPEEFELLAKGEGDAGRLYRVRARAEGLAP